jgi:hypothetical protein
VASLSGPPLLPLEALRKAAHPQPAWFPDTPQVPLRRLPVQCRSPSNLQRALRNFVAPIRSRPPDRIQSALRFELRHGDAIDHGYGMS